MGLQRVRHDLATEQQQSLDGTNVNFYNLAGLFTDLILIIHEKKRTRMAISKGIFGKKVIHEEKVSP